MNFIFDHPYLRSEFDWIASDILGFCGYFSTNGAGPVPQHAVSAPSLYDGLPESILKIERISDAIMKKNLPSANWTEWYRIACSGFFAYDWSLSESKYIRIATPMVPKKVDGISDQNVRKILNNVKLSINYSVTEAYEVYG